MKIYTIALTFHTQYNVMADLRSVAIRKFVQYQIKKGRFDYNVFVIDGLFEKECYELSNGEKYYVYQHEVIK